MKRIFVFVAASLTGVANAGLLIGDTVDFTFGANIYASTATLVEGIDHTVGTFNFDFNSQTTDDVFLWTSTPIAGALGGSTGLTISGLDFMNDETLTGFDLFSSSLSNFSYSILSSDSISFNWASAEKAAPGTVIEGRFLTQGQAKEVSEPSSLVLLGFGIAGFIFSRKKNLLN
jgi:hypothetical protein